MTKMVTIELNADDVVDRILNDEHFHKAFLERVKHAAWVTSSETVKKMMEEKYFPAFNVMADAAVKALAEDYFKKRFGHELEMCINSLVMREVQSSVRLHIKAAMDALSSPAEHRDTP